MSRRIDGYGLGTFDDDGREFAGVVAGDRVLEVAPGVLSDGPATVLAILENWGSAAPELAALATTAVSDGVPLEALRIRPPLRPGQIFQAGANYRSHVAEMIVSGKEPDDNRTDDELRVAAEEMMDHKAATGSAFIFAGLASAMCGADDDVVLIEESEKTDWEAELAVVIGRIADRVDPDEALDYVAGYTIANDISARDLQFPPEHRVLGGDWLRAKCRPTFLPVGPFVMPAEVVGDYRDLEITFDLNGQRMQQDKAANMLFGVPSLIAQSSAITPLQPGDLILTGSPAGNGGKWQRWLKPGDVMEASISGLSSLRNVCRAS